MKEKSKATGGYFLISAVLIAVDQLVKHWASTALRQRGAIVLIDGVLGLRYAENTGAAFSAFSGATFFLSLFSLAVCVVVALWLARGQKMHWLMKLSLAMILAGGVGNLIDRAAKGFVVDLFEVLFMRFAIFNVADICITLGAVGLFFIMMFGGDARGRMDH